MSHHEHVERIIEQKIYVVDGITVRRLRRYSEYGVSENGEIVRFYSERNPFPVWLKPCKNENGYLTVSIRRDDGEVKTRRVHRLVGQAWVTGRTKIRFQIDHIDGNKHNNHKSNLRWVSNQENNEKRAHQTKNRRTNVKNLDRDEVLFIFKNGLVWCREHPRKTPRRAASDLGLMFDVSVKSIRKIQCRIHRRDVTDTLYIVGIAYVPHTKESNHEPLRRDRGVDRSRKVHTLKGFERVDRMAPVA